MIFKKTIEIDLEIPMIEMKKWIKTLSLEYRLQLFLMIKKTLPGDLWTDISNKDSTYIRKCALDWWEYQGVRQGEIADKYNIDCKTILQHQIEEIYLKEVGLANNQSEILIDFLFYLNNKGLINDYDFDYEKEAKKFLKFKQKK